MNTTKPILSSHDLTVGYGKKAIARGLSLELHKSEMVCLLGQNGVGKSTLLRTLSNLQQSLGGSIKINDQDLTVLTRQELARKIGIVTTEKVGMANMTVRELVSTGRYYATDWLGNLAMSDEKMVENAIDQCQINYIADHKLSTLSDGQRQKAMIARALAQDADIIFLDEPTAHLDVVNRIEVMKLLSEIKRDKCVLISTHELPLSMQFADKLWLMNFNQPMIVGKPDELIKTDALSKTYFHDDFDIDFETGRVIAND